MIDLQANSCSGFKDRLVLMFSSLLSHTDKTEQDHVYLLGYDLHVFKLLENKNLFFKKKSYFFL